MPQPWTTVAELAQPDHPYAPYAVDMASYILFKLTGEKYQGVHTVTEHYGLSSQGMPTYRPAVVGGKMYNLPAGANRSVDTRKLYLRHAPVRSIQSVTVAGQLLDPSQYSLRNKAFIVRTGPMGWYFSGMGEIVVEYTYGANPPKAGVEAAIRLANELVWAEMGSNECSLPQRVTSIQRQGVSMTIMDSQDFLEEGKTGIYSIDLFIKASNPSGAQKKARIFSAARPHGERIN